MSDARTQAIHVWASELAKRLPEGVRPEQTRQYIETLDAECGSADHVNLVGGALRTVRGAIPVAAVRTAAHDIRDPRATSPTEASAKDCAACHGAGFAGAWWLRTPEVGRPATMERVAVTAQTEGLDPHSRRTDEYLAMVWRGIERPALARKVPGFPGQDVMWAVSACQCDYGQHLRRLRAARESK